MQSEARRTPVTLAHPAATDVGPARPVPSTPDTAQGIAEAAVSTWCRIEAALAPVIGQRGVAALYRRSLHLTRGAHPVLAAITDGEHGADDFVPLRQALLQGGETANAEAAQTALLKTFQELLTSLIGGALTDQLLRAVWHDDPPTTGPAVQDLST